MKAFFWLKRAIASFFLGLIWVYQKVISPLLPAACIYHPTCSHYAKDAVIKHGPFMGVVLAAKRLLSCHTLFHRGGIDYVPDRVTFKNFFRKNG